MKSPGLIALGLGHPHAPSLAKLKPLDHPSVDIPHDHAQVGAGDGQVAILPAAAVVAPATASAMSRAETSLLISGDFPPLQSAHAGLARSIRPHVLSRAAAKGWRDTREPAGVLPTHTITLIIAGLRGRFRPASQAFGSALTCARSVG